MLVKLTTGVNFINLLTPALFVQKVCSKPSVTRKKAFVRKICTFNIDEIDNRVGSHSSLSSTVGTRTVYGRLKRVPKLPAKPALQSSESSSATDDLSGSEESSSSCLEDADAEAQQVSNLQTVSRI